MEVKVSLTEGCSAKCESCLCHKIKNPRYMTFETWKRIISQVVEHRHMINKFHFYSIGESLLHPDFQKFIDYAHKHFKGTNIATVLITNGSIDLTKYDLSKVKEVIVSFNAYTKEVYERTIKLSWDNGLKNIKKAAELYPVQVHVLNFNNEQIEDMENELFNLKDNENIRIRISSKVDNQCGEFYESKDDIKRIPCSYIHVVFCFNPNGDLLRCAHDFHDSTIYGNIKDKSLQDFIKDKAVDLQNHINRNYEGICKDCNFNVNVNEAQFLRWL